MKLVIFGATGQVGQRLVREALDRGHTVTGVVRDPSAVTLPDPRARLIQGDATRAEDVARAISGADAVVSAISPRPNARGLAAPRLVDNARAVIAGMRNAGINRVLYVGGAGSLEVAPGQALVDQPGFPEAYRPEALEGRDALGVWRNEATGLAWTFLSPAIEIGPGERTGVYRKTGDQLLVDASGQSRISYEDFAVAALDELEHPEHIGRRFGVAY